MLDLDLIIWSIRSCLDEKLSVLGDGLVQRQGARGQRLNYRPGEEAATQPAAESEPIRYRAAEELVRQRLPRILPDGIRRRQEVHRQHIGNGQFEVHIGDHISGLQPVLADHRVRPERGAEDRFREGPQFG